MNKHIICKYFNGGIKVFKMSEYLIAWNEFDIIKIKEINNKFGMYWSVEMLYLDSLVGLCEALLKSKDVEEVYCNGYSSIFIKTKVPFFEEYIPISIVKIIITEAPKSLDILSHNIIELYWE